MFFFNGMAPFSTHLLGTPMGRRFPKRVVLFPLFHTPKWASLVGKPIVVGYHHVRKQFSCWVTPFQLGFPLFSPSILGVLYPYFLETPIINPYNSSIPKPPQLGRHLHRGKNPPRICGLFFFLPSRALPTLHLFGENRLVGRSVGWSGEDEGSSLPIDTEGSYISYQLHR